MNRIRERALTFLRGHTVMTLAVTTGNGTPHAAALFYAVDDDLFLYVLTDPTTRHGQAMMAHGIVAGTVQDDNQHWEHITGIQFRGRCRQLTGAQQAQAWGIYTARFPFLLQNHPTLTSKLTRTNLWSIEADWVRLIDNRLGFGHKGEWTRRPVLDCKESRPRYATAHPGAKRR